MQNAECKVQNAKCKMIYESERSAGNLPAFSYLKKGRCFSFQKGSIVFRVIVYHASHGVRGAFTVTDHIVQTGKSLDEFVYHVAAPTMRDCFHGSPASV